MEPDKAARLLTEALYIAATQDNESQVAEYLKLQLEQASLSVAGLQRTFDATLTADQCPPVTSVQHDLASYDQLLNTAPGRALSDPDEHPQTPQAQTLSRPVADPRTPSHPGALVLRPVSVGFGPGRSQSARTKSYHPRPSRSAATFRKVLDQL